MRRFLLCAVLTAACSVPAPLLAQDTVLFGRVSGSDHGTDVPTDWIVNVSVLIDGQATAGGARHSDGDLFACRVPQNATVTLIFEAPYYKSQKMLPPIELTPDRNYAYRVLPNIVLTRIATTYSGPTGGTGPVSRQITPEELQNELESQTDIAKITGSGDILQFNMRVYEHQFEAMPDHKATVDRIEGSQKFREIAIAPRGVDRRDVYKELVQSRTGESTGPGAGALLGVVTDQQVFPSIRWQASDVLIRTPLPEAVKEEALQFYRQVTANTRGEMRSHALAGLATLGEESDRQRLITELKSPDAQRVLDAVTALGETQIGSATGALATLVRETPDAAVRAAAVQSLGQIGGPDAGRVITDALTTDHAAAVRAEAAKALGTAAIQTIEMRRALEHAAVADVSPEVRTLAAGSAKASAATPK